MTPDGRNGTAKSRQDALSKHHQQVEIKEKIQKEYLRRTRKLPETKLSSRNLIKWINTWAALSLDIRDSFWSGPEKNLSKWTKE